MNFTDLIKQVASKGSYTQKQVREVYDLLVETVQEELGKEEVDKLSLQGLVTLVKVERAARTGRNPATGDAIEIPAKTVIKAKTVKAIKDLI